MNIRDNNQILDFKSRIQEWLTENVVQDGKPLYRWSDGKLLTVLWDINKTISNVLYFKHEEDLLAFRLKFGIDI